METSTLLRIRTDGSIVALHDESLGLSELGHREHLRASHVEFDESRQVWYVEEVDTGSRVFEHRLRSRCLSFERRHFMKRLQEGFRPFQRQRDD